MILERIGLLRHRNPYAFNAKPEELPFNPIEGKLQHQIVSFRRDTVVDPKVLSIHPADTLPVNMHNLPPLEADTELDEESRIYGTEASIWYKPFHLYNIGWGIYVRWRGVLHTAFSLYKAGYMDAEAELLAASLVKCAFKVLHSHAYFHFLAEWAAAFMESVLGKPFYLPYATSIRPENEELASGLEEPLANAYAFMQLDLRARNGLREFLAVQPTPYCDFYSYTDPEKFALGKRLLGARIRALSSVKPAWNLDSSQLREEPPWEAIFSAEPHQTCIWEVPIYWVVEPRPRSTLPQMIQLLMSDYKDRVEAMKKTLTQALRPKTPTQG